MHLPGLEVAPEAIGDEAAKFDLLLMVTPTADGLVASLTYDRDLFEAETADRLLAHYQGLLEGALDRPHARLSKVDFLLPSECSALAAWNLTDRAYPQGECLHDLIARSARERPAAVAIEHVRESLTYFELESRANQLAHRLQALGVGPEIRVGVCLERSLDLVVALLAVLKAGGAYVPLDPAYPKDRVAFMLEDSGVHVLVTRASLQARLPEVGQTTLCLEHEKGLIDGLSALPPASGALSENLAYVIYTSGSTGRPKGVAITHASAVALAHWALEAIGGEDLDGVAAGTSICFDLSVFELFVPLAHGGRVVLLENALALGELAPSAGVRLVNSVPSAVAQLLRTKGLPRSVRTVCLAGEPLSTGLVQQIHAGSSAERVFDLYGPSEDTTYSTFALRSPKGPETIGRPIANTRAYVLDRFGARVPVGAPGELALAGEGLARAYLGRPDLTAEKFVPDEWSGRPGARLYRTGDRARFLSDGRLEYLGRLDHQVKIRGFRIEPGEVEAVLGLHPAVDEVLVLAREDTPGDKRLVAYVAPRSEAAVPAEDLREHLRARVPEHMVPSAFVLLDRLPRTPNGKVDRKQLPAPAVAGRGSAKAHLYSASETEKAVAAIFAEALRVAGVGPEENFFDLGGHSLLLLDVHERLKVRFPELNLGIVDLFRYPTVAALAGHLAGNQASAAPRALTNARRGALQEPVAIIGLSGRFPGAANVHELWRNLREGRETVTFFGEEELRRAGVAEEVLRDPRYVRARGVLEGAEEFAAEFFGYSPREAQVMDPQQRVFLECAWDALENAGYDALRFSGLVGVYAGANISSYLLQNLSRHPHLLGEVGGLQAKIGNDKDSLATRVSYELNLRGPSLGVQTACSTSLVAVHLAALALRNGECDMALAGGVSIGFPQVTGYLYQDEGILSPDGHCRAFGAAAAGTVPGSGVGVVVLKRLEDARRDGDTIRAVIRGSAINNDGSVKVGYTAPSVSGQAEVIARALAAAGVPASRIGYVEAHGTGTRLGDPVEVEALTQAFRAETERRSFCALGSLKSNFGHLDTAAGVAGLIKAVLSLERREIFPSLHAETASPRIAFDESPFYVSRSPTPWVSDGPRYAAVSSFGIGGTNAHVVLEEAPAPPAPTPGRAMHILPLSARTPTALAAAAARLLGHLDTHEDQALADVAYTLQVGRKTFPHRQAVMCRDVSEARTALQGRESSRVVTGMAGSTPRPVAFLFPGQGAQHAGMGAELYQSEPVYRTEMDRCLEALRGHLSVDLKDLLFPRPGEEREADRRLGETQLTQPAIFATNWALARLWSSYGVTPVALLGHSVGEYVAACLADVLDLEDALRLVVERGRLLQSLPPGAMVALGVGEEEAAPLLGDALCLAAVNAKDQCVVAGPVEAVDDLEDRLLSRGVDFRRLATSHAFHSQMVEPVVGLFPKLWNGVRLRAPRIPYLSNLTGGWITAADATDPGYWARQMRGTVRFAECLAALLADGPCALLEAGPGRTLTQLVRRHPAFTADHVAFSSLGRGVVGSSESEHMTESLARLWTAGIDVDWTSLHAGAERRRVPLPGYPFERKRYFVDPGATRASVSMVAKRSDTRSWFYAPVWKSSPSPRLVRCREDDTTSFATLVFAEASGPGLALAERLAAEGKFSTVVRPGSRFEEGAQGFSIRPTAGEDYDALLSALAERGGLPARIIHAWSAIPSQAVAGSAIERFERAQERGFSSVFHLLRALARRPSGPEGRELVFVGAHLHDVTGAEPVFPEGLPALALGRVAAQELADLRFRGVDLEIPPNGQLDSRTLEALADECTEGRSGTVVALRGGRRWVQQFESLDAPPIPGAMPRVRDGGVYVVTGGLGEIGLEVAQRLAQLAHVRLVLIGRRVPPPCERWTEWLETHGAEEATSRIILKLREIEARGAELLVCAADVADRDAMRSALGEARSRWGGIQGVVHAAGTPRGASIAPLAELSPDHSREQFRSKALGVYVLEELLRTDDLDFCLLMSSLSTVLGGLGMGAYAAANLFMEGFAAGQFRSGREAWGSVSWDGWRLREELMKAASGPAASLALSREEGQDVFERLLRMRPLPQVVVSTADLEARRTRWVTMTGEIPREEAPAHEPAGRHPRPELGSQFVAARNPTERTIAEIWEGLLGVARVGIHDDFFELGGHSLLATRLTTRLRETFGAEIPLRAIFESPTVEGLANRVLADEAEPGQAQRVAEMLERLRGMSPEQKRRLLEQEKQARGQAT